MSAAEGPLAETAQPVLTSAAFLERTEPEASVLVERTVQAAAVVFAATFAILAALKHHNLATSKFNLGNFTQAVWSTAHGRLLEATADTGEQMARLGSHVEPILLLFGGAWWVWPSPVMLLTVQAVALGTGALPVFWLARKHLGEYAGRRLALAYLLYPSVGLLAVHEFHAVALAIPLLLFAVWYLDEDRLVPFAVCAILAAATKEQIGLAIAGLGLWYAFERRRVRPGAAIALGGVLWSAIAFLIVIPYFSAAGENPFAGRYAGVGGSPSGILQTLVTSPLDIVEAVVTPLNAVYLIALLVPVAGLCLLAPLALIPALPELAINLLSTHDGQKTIAWQYVAGIVPFIFLATVYGLRRRRPERIAFFSRIVVMAAALNLAISVPHIVSTVRPSMDRSLALQAMRLIPEDAPVSVSGHFGAQLAERERLMSFPTVAEADWIIVHRADAWIPWPVEKQDLARWTQAIRRVESDPAWRTVFDRGGILVLHRRPG